MQKNILNLPDLFYRQVSRLPVSVWRGPATSPSKLSIMNKTVFAIQKGKYSPSLEVAFKIAETFSVTLDEVFQYQGSKK